MFAGLIVAHCAEMPASVVSGPAAGLVPKMAWRTAPVISGLPQFTAKFDVSGDGPNWALDELSENVRRV